MLVEVAGGREREFVCSWCGYSVVLVQPPPVCPVCHALSPDFTAWQAFRELGVELLDPGAGDVPAAA
jgi:acetone carboxylase gamma subunit